MLRFEAIPIEYLNLKQDIESEGLFDAGGDRYIYISLEDFNKNRNDNNIIFLDNTFIDKDIIAKMYLHNGKFNINIDDNDGDANLKKREFMGPVDMKTIKVKLLDEYGNKWDLTKSGGRAQVRKYIAKNKPLWVIGSPPCDSQGGFGV